MSTVNDSDLFLAQYQMDSENIRYAKEIQWRVPVVLIGLDSAVIAALAFWKQAGLPVSMLTVIFLMIALGIFGLLGLYMINGVRMNLSGYRNRQRAISVAAFPEEFRNKAIKPDDYVRNKATDIVFQASFSLAICAAWVALLILLLEIAK